MDDELQENQHQFLTFTINDEEYGLDIDNVKEICTWTPPHPLPSVPDFIPGVINLRGDIIPIIDLRKKLGFSINPSHDNTVIVVVRDKKQKSNRLAGIAVDTVKEIYDLELSLLQPPPKYLHHEISDYINGMFNQNKRIIMIFDSEFVLSLSKHLPEKSTEDK